MNYMPASIIYCNGDKLFWSAQKKCGALLWNNNSFSCAATDTKNLCIFHSARSVYTLARVPGIAGARATRDWDTCRCWRAARGGYVFFDLCWLNFKRNTPIPTMWSADIAFNTNLFLTRTKWLYRMTIISLLYGVGGKPCTLNNKS